MNNSKYDQGLVLGLAGVVAMLVVNAVLSFYNVRQLNEDAEWVAHTHEVMDVLESAHGHLREAEAVQRSYLIRGGDQLPPAFDANVAAAKKKIGEAKTLTDDNPQRQAQFSELEQHVEALRNTWSATAAVRKRQGFEAARQILLTGESRKEMAVLHELFGAMDLEERVLLRERQTKTVRAYAIAVGTGIGTALLGLSVVGMFLWLVERHLRTRQQAAAQIHEHRQLLQATLASIGDAVIATDTQGRVTFLNSVAQELTGWSAEESAGAPLEKTFHIVNETTRQPVENPALRALRDGTIIGLANHTVLIAKNGGERPIDDSAAPIRDSSGAVAGAVLVFRDITDRKREEAVHAERARLVALRADVSASLASIQPTPAALLQCCEAFVRHLEAAFARIWTLDDAGKVLELQASAGLYTHLDGPHSRVPVGQYKIGRIAGNRQPHLTNAVADDPNVSDREWAAREGMIAFAGYPLAIENRTLGVVAMFARHPFSEGVLGELAPLAEGIAQYIDRKRVEERLREQAELHRTTLASIGDAVITTDVEGRIASMNAVAENLTGWKTGEAVGQPLETVFRIVNETTRRPVESPATRALKEGTVVGLANHTLLLARDGSERPIDDSAAPIKNAKAEILGCALVFRDVTERRRQERELESRERQFRTLAESIPQLAWMANPDGHIFWFNRRWYDYTGTTFEQMQGWGWQSVHDPEILPRVIERWQTSLASGEPFDMVFPLKDKGGAYHPFLTRIVPIKNDQGQVTRWLGTNTDVSEQKRAEEKMRQAEQFSREILESISDAFFAIDRDWRFTYVNAQAERLLDRRPGDLIGKSLWEAYPGMVGSAFEKAFRRAMTERIADSITALYPDRDRWYEIHVYPAAYGISMYFRDVTERKRTEERERRLLEEAATANAKFRAFFDQGTLFAGIVDVDGTILDLNRLSWAGCGFAREQVLGKLLWEGPWWKPSPTLAQEIKAAFDQALAGQTFRAEMPYHVGDGSERVIDLAILPVKDEAGRVTFLASTGTDVTDRKRAEADRQKFVTLAENSTDFIGMCDQQGTPFYINQAGLNLIGLESIEQARLTQVREFFFPEDQKKIMERFFPCVLRDGHGEIEIRFRHFRTGEARWMAFKVFALADAAGQNVVLGTVSQDVTDRRRMEDDLRNLAADLSETGRRKDEFLATLAHELRNPLAPIRNGLQVMRLAGNKMAMIEQARAMIERQLTQMVRLVDDLMDVSRISRGKIELRKERTELALILRNAVETSRPVIEQMEHQLEVTLPEQPIFMEADSIRLAQVFSNLLNNAAKYNEKKGRIWLNAEQCDHEAIVTVRDDGIGIATEHLPRIFEMFAQAERGQEKAQGGLGIGLTLVRRLVEMHGGSVEAKSDGPGHGAEFVVRFPIAADNPPPSAARADEPAVPKSSLHILIVDDNRDGADSLAMMLRFMGNETRTAYDGEEAVAAAADFRPDVILLDIGLPKLTGYEACQLIRAQPGGKKMIVIAQTGWGQEEDRQRTRAAGFDHHMVKPVDPHLLMKLLAGLQTAKGDESK